MNWLLLLQPILAEILKRLLERKANDSVQFPTAAGAPAAAVAKCDDLADQLEAAVAQRPKTAAATSDGGIVEHVTALVAALRSGDWNAIRTAFLDIISHL